MSWTSDRRWSSCEVRCVVCGHRHQSTHPINVPVVECPKCRKMGCPNPKQVREERTA